jgi:probable HAF family extracellular repeat protein
MCHFVLTASPSIIAKKGGSILYTTYALRTLLPKRREKMLHPNLRPLLIPSVLLWLLLPASLHGRQLTVLDGGSLSGEYSAYSVSSDGQFVGGRRSWALGNQAYMWSAAGVPSFLGLPEGSGFGITNGVSLGGTVAAGYTFSSATSTHQAFRWTESTGAVPLGFLQGDSYSSAADISADGSTIVGFSLNEQFNVGQAFRHTTGRGMEGLGTLAGHTFSYAEAISHDGEVIVGWSQDTPANVRPFRWTRETGMVELPVGVGTQTFAFDCSGDGSTVVGQVGVGGVPFILQGDGDLIMPQMYAGEASSVSADGSIVIGNGQFQSSGIVRPYIWTEEGGPRDLSDYLTRELGIDLGGFKLTRATDISADGNVIVGFGDFHNGERRAFIVTIPSPGATVVLLAATFFNQRRRRAGTHGR